MPLAGWLAGRFGVKYVVLASVIGFALASPLGDAAPSLGELVFFRAVQGVAGAGLTSLPGARDRARPNPASSDGEFADDPARASIGSVNESISGISGDWSPRTERAEK